MASSSPAGDTLYSIDGEPMVTACRMGRPMPACAYCTVESTRTRVGEHHDLCRDHAGGDRLATLKAGDTSQNVFWEIVEILAVPIPRPE